jgi:hypothetical protein
MDETFAEVGDGQADEPRRPAWVRRHGANRTVVAIEAEQHAPDRHTYRVRLDSGERVLLIWRRADARWSVTPVTPPYAPPSA